MDSLNDKCVAVCPDQYYISGYDCVKCNTISCYSCVNTSTTCTKCNDGSYLFENLCKSSCLAGYYANSTTNTCEECSYPCATCSNST